MIKKIAINLAILILLLIASTTAVQAYQIDPSFRPDNEPFALEEEIKQQGAAGATVVVLQILAGALLYFAVPLAVIMVVWSGSNMVIMGTQQEKLDEAKKHLLWSLIGLVLIILSYSLVRIIIGFILQAGSLA